MSDYYIRLAKDADLPIILDIYAHARQYMRKNGNPNQWGHSHPAEAVLREDIKLQHLYVCTNAGEILGVFCYFQGIDPTYVRIYDGQWQNNEPYGVIHRIAVAAHQKGVASACFHWALQQCDNLRIDTHADNIPMHKSLAKNGFAKCGIIYLENGDPRIAYHKKIDKTGT